MIRVWLFFYVVFFFFPCVRVCKDFKQHCQLKLTYYVGVSNYFSALFAVEQKKMGEAVGYISVAEAKLNECVKMRSSKDYQDTLGFVVELMQEK